MFEIPFFVERKKIIHILVEYRSERYFTTILTWKIPFSMLSTLDKTMVVHHIQDGDTIHVRYLSATQPLETATAAEPNLEDAYLCLLKGM